MWSRCLVAAPASPVCCRPGAGRRAGAHEGLRVSAGQRARSRQWPRSRRQCPFGRWAMGVQGGEAKTEPPQPRLGSVHQLPAWRQQGDLHLRGVVNNYVTPPPSQNGEDASRLLQSGADICKGALLFCFGFSAMCVCAKQTLPLVKTMRDGRQPVEERRIFPLKVSSQESLRKYRGSICLFQKAPG